MSLVAQQKEIDGRVYEVSPLDLRTSRVVLLRLMKLAGPALTEFAKNGQGVLGVMSGASQLFSLLQPEDLDYFCDAFQRVTKMKLPTGSWVPLVESAFGNDVGTQIKWLLFAVEVNYAKYLKGEVATLLRRFQPQDVSP